MRQYADVILSIESRSVDRTFTYEVPEELLGKLSPGTPVKVPFGNSGRLITGYVAALRESAPEGITEFRSIDSLSEKEVAAEAGLVALVFWMHRHYGCMLSQALKTVLPVKRKVRRRSRKAAAAEAAAPAEAALPAAGNAASPAGQEAAPGAHSGARPVTLNEEQRRAAEAFHADQEAGKQGAYFLFGITGSGKTEVYAEMIREILRQGRQAIVLLPEISLTFQTVERLCRLFGDQIAVIHSRLSAGEKYEQYLRARRGEAKIVVGPRSAVFAPLLRLGLIVIDEEHDSAYENDTVPRYDTRDVALRRAEIEGASVVLCSATPSVVSWDRVKKGQYRLLTLTRRAAAGAVPASVEVVDLRKELRAGNRSVFSRRLRELIEDRLQRREQIILFMNRRGYSNFVSCRSCGNAIRCPHCDVTLTLHRDGTLRCHYCGYRIPVPKLCPDCGSPFLAGFGTGTQKLEMITRKMFPEARVVRLDSDTASGKEAGSRILRSFADGEADILLGTQMVVKGHDFPRVTLVGIMAADTELYVSSYSSAERTFQLLTQAAGRAGRGSRPGTVVVQTYRPDHYAVRAAAAQDYGMFIGEESAYREAGGYPPAVHLLSIELSSKDEKLLARAADFYAHLLGQAARPHGALLIGPADAAVYRLQDYFRKMIYVKHSSYDILLCIKNQAEPAFRAAFPREAGVLYDFR